MLLNITALPPVTTVDLDGWKKIEIVTNAEELVPIGPFSDYPLLFTDSIYAGNRWSSPYCRTPEFDDSPGLNGSLLTIFVRLGVARALVQASEHLPKGVHLVIYDAYRPLQVQAALYDHYYRRLQQQHPNWHPAKLSDWTQRFVSLPSDDSTRPSPHNTGGAVDVGLIQIPKTWIAWLEQLDRAILECPPGHWQRRYSLEMIRLTFVSANAYTPDFGTPFDHGGEAAAADHHERLGDQRPLSAAEERACFNRRVLAAAMTRAGFSTYIDEWWHFNLGNQMDAKATGKQTAKYGAIELSVVNRSHEHMRRSHWPNTISLAKGDQWRPPAGLEQHYQLARSLAVSLPRPDQSWHIQMAEQIAPSAS